MPRLTVNIVDRGANTNDGKRSFAGHVWYTLANSAGNTMYAIERGYPDSYAFAALASSDIIMTGKPDVIPDAVYNVPPDDPCDAEYDEDYTYGPAPGM